MTAGDNVYDLGTDEEFEKCYDPTWGRVLERTRPVPGNHDYGTAGAAGYFRYFGRRAGPVGRGWYAFDHGTWRIYALDSDCELTGQCRRGSSQYRWLQGDLAKHPRRCVMAVLHHPSFSSGPHGNSRLTMPLLNLLYRAGAELVVNGHDHIYERFAPARPWGGRSAAHGMRQFIVGTGGAPLYDWKPDGRPAHSVVRQNEVHGVLRLDLRWDGYAWRFVPVAGGRFEDAGTGTCHARRTAAVGPGQRPRCASPAVAGATAAPSPAPDACALREPARGVPRAPSRSMTGPASPSGPPDGPLGTTPGRGHAPSCRPSLVVRSALPMNVLVAVASRHGASLQIGEVVATTLRASGLPAELHRVEDLESVDGYDAVVLGSGVYAGHWLRRARVFVDAFETQLLQRPLWLFSSGPVGDPPRPQEGPAEVAGLIKRLGARGHRLFGGRIEGTELGLAEKALVALVRAPAGDFRPWTDIAVWAESIAAELQSAETAHLIPSPGRTTIAGRVSAGLDSHRKMALDGGATMSTRDQVMAELEALGTEQTRKTYRRQGSPSRSSGSASAICDRGQAHRAGPRPGAGAWQTGNFNARLVACMVADPAEASEAELDASSSTSSMTTPW